MKNKKNSFAALCTLIICLLATPSFAGAKLVIDKVITKNARIEILNIAKSGGWVITAQESFRYGDGSFQTEWVLVNAKRENMLCVHFSHNEEFKCYK